MSMTEKISIIVPVYNQEKYLDQCLNSILNQSYSNFECILVDDGSTDASSQICDDYEKKDGRIKVIHKENGGLTSARKSGFDSCLCDYICFLDSDDYLHKDFLKISLEKIIQENADVCTCGHFQDQDGIIIEDTFDYPVYKVEKRNVLSGYVLPIIGKIYADGYLNYPGYVWGRIYKKKCISQDCFVSEREVYTEDDLFQMYLSKNINKAIFIPDKLVYYRVNQSSLTHSYRKNMWSMLKKRHEHVNNFLSCSIESEVQDRILASAFYAIYVTLRNSFELTEFSKFKAEIADMLSDDMPDEVFKNYKKELLKPRQKMMVFLLKNRLYFCLYHCKKLLFK